MSWEVKPGGEWAENQQGQSRKSAKTSNMIFLCDNGGQMLSMGNPRNGNHHDLYEIEDVMGEIVEILSEAKISSTLLQESFRMDFFNSFSKIFIFIMKT